MASITSFIGHFHPVLVHLPIGILLAAIGVQAWARKKNNPSLNAVLPALYSWGALSASASALSGYLLSLTDDYDQGLLNLHQWMGIALSLLAWLSWWKARKSEHKTAPVLLALLLLLSTIITGHFGGSLTHGSSYLWESLGEKAAERPATAKLASLPDIQQAKVYADLIQPLLQEKCAGCHGPQKQKGRLRLDVEEGIRKGGKKGHTLVAGQPEQSELIRRLLLPVDQEEHMPPKEKPQPTENEIALLQWWISSGADFSKQIKDLPQTDRIKHIFASLQQAGPSAAYDELPSGPVKAADEMVLRDLRARGVVVIPVAAGSNYLQASFVTRNQPEQKDFELLQAISRQLIALKLSFTPVNDSLAGQLAALSQLRKLYLDHTFITDKALLALGGMKELRYLNLVQTRVTAKGLQSLDGLDQLRSIYLYKTAVTPDEFPGLRKLFPEAAIDTGGYRVSTLASDTTRLSRQQKK